VKSAADTMGKAAKTSVESCSGPRTKVKGEQGNSGGEEKARVSWS